MKRTSSFGNENYGQESYPFNDYFPPGITIDQQDYGDHDTWRAIRENLGPKGDEFADEREEMRKARLRRLKRIKRLKLLKQLMKEEHQDTVLQPSPFYENLYGGYFGGIEGTQSYPLENYPMSIQDGPETTTNPWNNTYQSASNERVAIRKMSFQDLFFPSQ